MGQMKRFSKETRKVKHCSLNVSFHKQFLLETLSHCSCNAQFCTPPLGSEPTNLCGINFKHVVLWTSIGLLKPEVKHMCKCFQNQSSTRDSHLF